MEKVLEMLESLGDRRGAFIGSQDALAGLDQRIDGRLQLVSIAHRAFLHASGVAKSRIRTGGLVAASARQAQLSRRAGSKIGIANR